MDTTLSQTTLDGEREKTGLAVERRVDGRLWAIRDGEATPVTPARCFPWSAPMRCLSLRDDEQEEAFDQLHRRPSLGTRQPRARDAVNA